MLSENVLNKTGMILFVFIVIFIGVSELMSGISIAPFSGFREISKLDDELGFYINSFGKISSGLVVLISYFAINNK